MKKNIPSRNPVKSRKKKNQKVHPDKRINKEAVQISLMNNLGYSSVEKDGKWFVIRSERKKKRLFYDETVLAGPFDTEQISDRKCLEIMQNTQ